MERAPRLSQVHDDDARGLAARVEKERVKLVPTDVGAAGAVDEGAGDPWAYREA
jgi:hypothetical protein